MILLFGSIRKFLDTVGNNSEIEERSWHDRIMDKESGPNGSGFELPPEGAPYSFPLRLMMQVSGVRKKLKN